MLAVAQRGTPPLHVVQSSPVQSSHKCRGEPWLRHVGACPRGRCLVAGGCRVAVSHTHMHARVRVCVCVHVRACSYVCVCGRRVESPGTPRRKPLSAASLEAEASTILAPARITALTACLRAATLRQRHADGRCLATAKALSGRQSIFLRPVDVVVDGLV